MAQKATPQAIKEFQNTFAWIDESIIVAEAQKRPDVINTLNAKGTIKVKIGFNEKPFWHSKKFWGGIFALGIVIGDQFTGANLWTVALPALVYIFGQGLADLGKNKPMQ